MAHFKRKIHLGDAIWTYQIGRGGDRVLIKDPQQKLYKMISRDYGERENVSLGPGDIKYFIEEVILGNKESVDIEKRKQSKYLAQKFGLDPKLPQEVLIKKIHREFARRRKKSSEFIFKNKNDFLFLNPLHNPKCENFHRGMNRLYNTLFVICNRCYLSWLKEQDSPDYTVVLNMTGHPYLGTFLHLDYFKNKTSRSRKFLLKDPVSPRNSVAS